MALPLPSHLKDSLAYRVARGAYYWRDSRAYKSLRQMTWRRRFNRRILKDYLASADIARLQIGSGEGQIPGWLNSDNLPFDPRTYHLDATAPFDVPSDSFDLIYCEHMIEHVPYGGAESMLKECHRVLKRGGRIRIATPPLDFLIQMVRDPGKGHHQYVAWHIETFRPDAPPLPVVVFNDFVRNWGHVHIYDEPTLRVLLERAGFTDIAPCQVNESPEPLLRGLEREDRMPPGLYALQTFILEARC